MISIVICLRNSQIPSIGESIGYFAYGDTYTYTNTIFVNENWFKSKM